MAEISLNKDLLDRFICYMAFFEYVHLFKDQEIVSRRLTAPNLDEYSNIKKRMSQVILKGLRSSQVYNCGQTFTGPQASAVIEQISRRTVQSDEIERYMQFVLDLNISYNNQNNILNIDANGNHDFVICSDEDKPKIIKSVIGLSATQDITTAHEKVRTLFNTINDNYIIGFTKQVANVSNNNIPLSQINIGNDAVSINRRQVAHHPAQQMVQDTLWTVTSYGGSINYIKLLEYYNYGRNINFTGGTARAIFSNYHIETEAIPGMFTKNFYIPITADDRKSGTIIFAKKQIEDGNIVIDLTQHSASVKYDLVFAKEAILNPATFLNLNKQIVSYIRRTIEGVGNGE